MLTWDELLPLIEYRWREAFLQFIESGEADESFLQYLDQDADCQRAVELAFTRQAQAFQAFAQVLKSEESPPSQPASVRLSPDEVSACLVVGLEGVLELPKHTRMQVLRRAVGTLEKLGKSEDITEVAK